MRRIALVFGGPLALAGALAFLAPAPVRAAGPGFVPHTSPYPYGSSFGLPYGGSNAPSLDYARRTYPYYTYAYNYGLYPTYRAPSNNPSYWSGYAEWPESYESSAYQTPSYGQDYASSSRGSALYAPPTEEIARVVVKVPAGAQVWFDNHLTTTTGTVRPFETPPLPPGREFTYQVKARWTQDGHDVTQEQKVLLSAGSSTQLTFPAPEGKER